jgi:hypothetical protein
MQVVDFYEFYEGLQEGWDGPALLVFSDGKRVGARLDRNGLRPARFWRTADDTIYVASEVQDVTKFRWFCWIFQASHQTRALLLKLHVVLDAWSAAYLPQKRGWQYSCALRVAELVLRCCCAFAAPTRSCRLVCWVM